MSGSTQYSSMAAHSLYIAPSVVQPMRSVNVALRQPLAVATAAPFAAPAQSAMMHANPSGNTPVFGGMQNMTKRGRSSDAAESPDAMDQDDHVEDQQRCIYYRKSIVFTSAKRAKAMVETQV
ncbi:hypothetical protein LPJ53_003514 [Coemansia erecta]|uniref:Uncharacterized protein n=1 Tax=Coemansia erecta TaxID=147472 RepID=A0A9W8CQR6_9FUNG|nr:hypothetical protein LPJ53_003514 [Coemansia erecta]